jgi:hypothetical protein
MELFASVTAFLIFSTWHSGLIVNQHANLLTFYLYFQISPRLMFSLVNSNTVLSFEKEEDRSGR